MQLYTVVNLHTTEVDIHDLGIILATEETRELTDDFDVTTILASLKLKQEVMYGHVSVNSLVGLDGFALLTQTNVPQFQGFYLTWTQFKTFINQKENVAVYFNLGCRYHVFSPLYPYFTFIFRGAPVAEVSTIDVDGLTPAGLSGKYFTMSCTGHDYYIWFDLDNGSSDPNVADKIGIEVDIATGDTDINIADKLETVMHAHEHFSASFDGTVVTITVADHGAVLNSIDAGNTVTTVAVVTQGNDYLKTTDEIDFDDNYKDWCDNVKTIRADGRTRVHSTVLMENEHPMFVGCDDGEDRDECDNMILLDLSDTPGEVHDLDLTFVDQFRLEDGCMMYEGAPWGATISAEIVSPGPYPPLPPEGTVCRRFIKSVPLYGTNEVGLHFDTDSPGRLIVPFIFRIRVVNPDGVQEVSTIDLADKSTANLAGKYFTLNSHWTSYYGWFDLDDGSSDPAPGGTGIEADITTGDTDEEMTTALATAINALEDFSASADGTVVTITNADKGGADNIADVNTGCEIVTVIAGVDIPTFDAWKLWGWVKGHKEFTTVAEEAFDL